MLVPLDLLTEAERASGLRNLHEFSFMHPARYEAVKAAMQERLFMLPVMDQAINGAEVPLPWQSDKPKAADKMAAVIAAIKTVKPDISDAELVATAVAILQAL